MKKIPAVLIFSFLLTGCATTHMIVSTTRPDFRGENSATLVIINDNGSFLYRNILVRNYLDNKLIGETQGNTYFITRVSPGWHYVIDQDENTTVVQMYFRSGRVYYLHQDFWPGLQSAQVGFSVMSQTDAVKAMKTCSYWEYDSKNPGRDMYHSGYAQYIKIYQLKVKHSPADYKSFLEYPGYIPQ